MASDRCNLSIRVKLVKIVDRCTAVGKLSANLGWSFFIVAQFLYTKTSESLKKGLGHKVQWEHCLCSPEQSGRPEWLEMFLRERGCG